MTDRITVNVAGAVTIEALGRRIRLRRRKAQALLAFLALSGRRSVTRGHLAALLWSDASASNANTSLRQILREVRSAIPGLAPAISIGRNEITVDYDRLTTDVDQLTANLGLGIIGTDLSLRNALGPDLLDGLDDISEGFQEWLDQCRGDLERRVLEAFSTACADIRFDWKTRETMASAVQAREPLNEIASRVLIEAAARRGDAGTALKIYERLYNLLDEQMGMEPSQDTRDLVVAIKSGAQGRGTATSLSSAQTENPLAVSGEPLLLVIPFRTVGMARDQQVGRAIAEDLVASVYSQREFRVVPASIVRRLLRQGKQPEDVARQLGAGYMLTGSIVQQGSACKLTSELARVGSSVVVWAETFEVEKPQQLHAQLRIARSIAHQIRPALRGTELRIANAHRTDNLSAYHLILRAQERVYKLEPEAFADAERLLRLALERDPSFPAVHMALADWHSLKLGQGWSTDPRQDRSEISRYAGQAMRLGGLNGRALAMVAHNQAIYSRAYDEALRMIADAVELAPNDAETLMWSSPTLAYTENQESAVRNAVKAIELSPYDPLLFRYLHFASLGFFAQGDYQLAADYGLRSMEGNANYTSNLRVTAASLVAVGRRHDAIQLRNRVMALEPDFSVSAFVARQAFRDPGRRMRFGKQLIEAGFPQ